MNAERLHTYAERVRALRLEPPESAHRIARYSGLARQLMAADARARWEDLSRDADPVRLRDGLAPSLLHLTDLTVADETRFSLLLAGLLDPIRGGPIAVALWPALWARLLARAEGERQETLRAALAAWSPDLLARMQVDPQSNGAEWNKLDIFARVLEGADLRFALVIENKVRADTEEGHRQLARYYDRIAEDFRDGVDRTVFVFLTEGPRAMHSAEHSGRYWHPLHWADIAACLGDIASAGTLPEGWRWLALSARDTIRQEILRLRSAEAARRSLLALHARTSAALTDLDWIALHGAILDATTDLQDLP